MLAPLAAFIVLGMMGIGARASPVPQDADDYGWIQPTPTPSPAPEKKFVMSTEAIVLLVVGPGVLLIAVGLCFVRKARKKARLRRTQDVYVELASGPVTKHPNANAIPNTVPAPDAYELEQAPPPLYQPNPAT